MRTTLTASIAAVIAIAACSKDPSTTDAPSAPRATTISASRSDHHPVGVEWAPAPPVFPPGAEMAVLQGDPSKAEEFTVRLRMPNGYKIPPHTHPTTENVTVLSGKFLAGFGTQFNEANLQAFARDDFASIPAEHAHYAMARGETVVQVHAIGPFVLTYVNPADNPMAR